MDFEQLGRDYGLLMNKLKSSDVLYTKTNRREFLGISTVIAVGLLLTGCSWDEFWTYCKLGCIKETAEAAKTDEPVINTDTPEPQPTRKLIKIKSTPTAMATSTMTNVPNDTSAQNPIADENLRTLLCCGTSLIFGLSAFGFLYFRFLQETKDSNVRSTTTSDKYTSSQSDELLSRSVESNYASSSSSYPVSESTRVSGLRHSQEVYDDTLRSLHDMVRMGNHEVIDLIARDVPLTPQQAKDYEEDIRRREVADHNQDIFDGKIVVIPPSRLDHDNNSTNKPASDEPKIIRYEPFNPGEAPDLKPPPKYPWETWFNK
jgi:hypothetical protein